MALVTGSPIGNIINQEGLYIEGAPYIFIQDNRANPLFNPDANGYYWNLSGTTPYPVIAVGCVTDVSLTEDLTMNDVRCDNIGVVSTIQKRNFIDFNITMQSLFPLSTLRYFLNLSPATSSTDVETVGIPQIDNTIYYMVYAPKVYNADADWLMFHLHRAQFVDAWSIDMTYGENWKATGLKLRAFADVTKPDDQLFGVIRRYDPSVLP